MVVVLLAAGAAGQRLKLPRPERLDGGVEYRRNPVTGELRSARTPGAAEESRHNAGTIRTQVNLVSVTANVLAPDGSQILGLSATDFRVFENGVEQGIEHFDASTQPARVALIMDTSPSIYRELGTMKQAAQTLAARLATHDEVAVVAFAADTWLVLPFTADRKLLDRAIDSLELTRGPAGRRGSHVYEAVYLATGALFSERTAPARRAIVLLTDGQDSHLGLSWDPASAAPRSPQHNHLTFEDVCRVLTAAAVEVHAISVLPRPKAMTTAWLAAHRETTLIAAETQAAGIPHYTAYLAELVRRVGGQLYFLGDAGTLANVYRQVGENLRAQYTLGYYPAAGLAQPGWRTIRVEVRGRPDLLVTHRAAYYVPATP